MFSLGSRRAILADSELAKPGLIEAYRHGLLRRLHFQLPSMHFAQGVLKAGNNSNYRTVPKHRSRNIFPIRARRKQNRFVPIEPFLNAAIRLRLKRSSGCVILQFRRHDVLRVPELARSAVCDSPQRAATRRPPVRREDRLPYHKNPHLSVGVSLQQLLNCGGPPQTGWSSRRQQEDESRNARFGIERFLELRDTTFRECDHRLLAAWRGARTPKVSTRQQDKDRRRHHADEPFLFHLPENLSAMNAAISCGNRIIPTTTTRAVHSSTFPIMRPRIEHCLARCCCQNPRPSSTTDSPNSHGRSVVKKALAALAPTAAANPSGRQQLIVATELRIATSDAEMPVPCFNGRSLHGPRPRRDAPSQREGDRFRPSPSTDDSSRQRPSPGETLPPRHVR